MKSKDIINRVDIRKFRFWIQLIAFIIFVYGGYFAIDLGRELPIFSCGYNRECRGELLLFRGATPTCKTLG